MDKPLRCKEQSVSQLILFNLCGHGHFCMQACTDFFAGILTDRVYHEAEGAKALSDQPSGRIRGLIAIENRIRVK